MNGPPEEMFSDALERERFQGCKGLVGKSAYTGEEAKTVDTDFYTSGFVCKDLSAANTLSPKRLDHVLGPDSGDSSRTLHASLDYVCEHEPALVLLENVYRKTQYRP